MLTDYRVRQREYLLQISRALTAQLNLDELLQIVLEAATEILSGQAGLIALRDSGGGFRITASYGLPRALVPHFEPLLADVPEDVDQAGSTSLVWRRDWGALQQSWACACNKWWRSRCPSSRS